MALISVMFAHAIEVAPEIQAQQFERRVTARRIELNEDLVREQSSPSRVGLGVDVGRAKEADRLFWRSNGPTDHPDVTVGFSAGCRKVIRKCVLGGHPDAGIARAKKLGPLSNDIFVREKIHDTFGMNPDVEEQYLPSRGR